MRIHYNIFKCSILLAFFFFLLSSNASAWWWNDDYQCNDIDEDGIINVMTINLLFSEIANRDQRLSDIAEFAADNDIHVIMLQEVVGGLLVGTQNSAKDLQHFLKVNHGKDYNLKTAFETGLPGLLAVANAVLSRCEIKFSLVKRLSRATEIEFDGRVIKLPRNVQMVRLKVPGRDCISVYNTHWCSSCSPEELAVQSQESFEFLNIVENLIPGETPIIFGGDLNLDRFRSDVELYLYDDIVDQGFNDAYADFIIANSDPAHPESLDTLCNSEEGDVDVHCTDDVTFLSPPSKGPRRIDYLFTNDLLNVIGAEVVFNPFGTNPPDENKPSVSDHAAVVNNLVLP